MSQNQSIQKVNMSNKILIKITILP